jgi:hypothetical protein
MTTQTAAQKAPRAIPSATEPKQPEAEATTRGDDHETQLDDDLYANLAHTD